VVVCDMYLRKVQFHGGSVHVTQCCSISSFDFIVIISFKYVVATCWCL